MIKNLNEAKQYLRTDYYAHVKLNSKVEDHCFNYALSDFKSQNFQQKCLLSEEPHKHGKTCIRCQQVRDALGEVRNTVVDLIEKNNEYEEELKDIQESMHEAENKIIEMKKHILRAEFSNNQRKEIISSLETNHALITMDWGMKFLPKKAREATIDWFGKRGLSYHIAHVIANTNANNNNHLMQHTFVHIFENEIQVFP